MVTFGVGSVFSMPVRELTFLDLSDFTTPQLVALTRQLNTNSNYFFQMFEAFCKACLGFLLFYNVASLCLSKY